MDSHFWLDETNTFAATNGGFSGIYARCVEYPISILYIALMTGLRALGAAREWVFRLPSLIAFALSTWCLFRLARRMFDDRIAWFSIAIFTQIGSVLFAAADARPYALGMLFVVVSTDLLVRLVDVPSRRLAIWYGITAALVVHFHFFMGMVLIVHIGYFLQHYFSRGTPRKTYALLAVLSFAAFASPLLFQILAMTGQARNHVMPGSAGFADLLVALFPTRQSVALVAAACVSLAAYRKVRWKPWAGFQNNVVLAFAWMLAPPLVLFLVSRTSPIMMFHPRYFLPYAPGLALCFGVVMGSLLPRMARHVALMILTLNAAVPLVNPAQLKHTHSRGDWASALAFVQRATAADHAPVLIRSQYVESDFDDLSRPMDDNWDFSPLSYYHVHAQWIPVPLTFTEREAAALNRQFDGALSGPARLLFVSFTGPTSYQPYLKYLEARLGPSYRMRQLGTFDYVDVFEFACP